MRESMRSYQVVSFFDNLAIFFFFFNSYTLSFSTTLSLSLFHQFDQLFRISNPLIASHQFNWLFRISDSSIACPFQFPSLFFFTQLYLNILPTQTKSLLLMLTIFEVTLYQYKCSHQSSRKYIKGSAISKRMQSLLYQIYKHGNLITSSSS